jgi:hypothetical protein
MAPKTLACLGCTRDCGEKPVNACDGSWLTGMTHPCAAHSRLECAFVPLWACSFSHALLLPERWHFTRIPRLFMWGKADRFGDKVAPGPPQERQSVWDEDGNPTRREGATRSSPRHVGCGTRLCAPCGLSRDLQHSAQRPNTYRTVALRWSLSSGVSRSFVREVALGPDAIAIYCLPLTSNVIGGAPNPAPTLIFHN